MQSLISGGVKAEQDYQARKKIEDFHSDTLDSVWLRMAETFGHAWESQNGIEPTLPWKKALHGINRNDIAKGFDRMYVEWKSDFPPNAIKFRELCQKKLIAPTGTKGEVYVDAYLSIHDERHTHYTPRPKAITDQAAEDKKTIKGNKAFDNLKAMMRGK